MHALCESRPIRPAPRSRVLLRVRAPVFCRRSSGSSGMSSSRTTTLTCGSRQRGQGPRHAPPHGHEQR
jgi:hypothetical protein